MEASRATEAFTLLGVAPFLFADGAAFEHLKKSFAQKARATHPDLVSSADEKARDEAEARAASLNAAWRSIKDFEGRLELALAAYPENGKPSPAAPEIALRYFELQELLLEAAPGARQQLEALQTEVARRLIEEKKCLYEIAQRYPLKPEGAVPLSGASASWALAAEDLHALRKGRNAVRYLERLAEDLEKQS